MIVHLEFQPSPLESLDYEFQRSFTRNSGTFARWAGRVMAHRMFTWTKPISQGGKNGGEGRNMFPVGPTKKRIGRDINIAYPSWDDENWFNGVYGMVKAERGKPAADAWWSIHKKNSDGYYDDPGEAYDPVSGTFSVKKRRKSALEVAQSNGFIKSRRPDDKRYAQARKKVAPGSFDAKMEPIAMVSGGARRATLKRREKRAGMAKAAWKQAADSFGPTNSPGKGAFKMFWPREANVVNKATGGKVGHGAYLLSGTTIYIRAENKIRYADAAIETDHWDRAIDDSERQIKIVMEQRLRAMLRTSTKRKAA